MFRPILAALSLLICSHVSAAVLEQVDYMLPQNGWKVHKEFNTDKTRMIIYIPQNAEIPTETYSVQSLNVPLGDTSAASLEAGMRPFYPDADIKITPLEVSDKSALYEWSIAKDGNAIMHGWTRAFATSNGSAMVTFQTGDNNNVDQQRVQWLPILKAARENQPVKQ